MKLYRFRYSPYARKVQAVLDLLGTTYEIIEVPYGDRTELATLTGGYIYVPVWVDEAGEAVTESRRICERLLADPSAAAQMCPAPFEGPIWAYQDFVDGPLEDILFRIASPSIRDAWARVSDRALYVLIKERKFGAGCVDAWERERPSLFARGQHLLAPTLRTLAQRPFLFGDAPTLADAALYGCCAMLEEADPALLAQLSADLPGFMRRLEAAIPAD